MVSLGSRLASIVFSFITNFNTLVGFFDYIKDFTLALRGSNSRGKVHMKRFNCKNGTLKSAWMKIVIGILCLVREWSNLAPHPIMIKMEDLCTF